MNLMSGGQPDKQTGGDGLEAYAPGVGAAPASSGRDEGPTEPAAEGGGLRVSLMLSDARGDRGPDMGRRILLAVLVLVLETVILGTAYFFVIRTEGTRAEERMRLEEELKKVQADVAEAEKDAKDVVAFTSQTKAVSGLLDSHIYWTTFFRYLEDVTRPTVRYLNFIGDVQKGVVTVDAMGDSYRDVAEQIVLMREQPLIEEVRTTQAAAAVNGAGEVSGVSFSMILKLAPELWARSAPTPARTTTSAPPASVAAESAPAPTTDVSDTDEAAASGFCGSIATDERFSEAQDLATGALSCMDDAFAACAQGSVNFQLTGDGRLASYRIETTGGSGGSCTVTVTAYEVFESEKALEGLSMDCSVSNRVSGATSGGGLFEAALSRLGLTNFAACDGTLREWFDRNGSIISGT